MALGGNVEAVMQLLELMDESEDWHMGDFDVLGDDASDSDSDSEGEFENVQAQLSRMHTHGSRGYKPYRLGNKQAMSTHEKILWSIEEDDRLFYVRGLGSKASMDELELACVSLLSLVMEPNLDEELVDDGVVGGRRKKAHRPRRPYTVTCALRQTDWFERSFTWENEQFRALYRMSKPTFWAIVKILE
ncbi:hypothetical protein FS749_001233 [Ceratobasidium sp. UAMH 11750]|nr:hypothetical protein FS749_001233 [Ceratobasidium sp. UAMH 11750]